jgi:hypothetical protein
LLLVCTGCLFAVGSTIATDLSNAPSLAHCATNATLAGGSIEGNGLANDQAPSFKLAITGDTDQYDMAKGEITVQPLSPDRTIVTIDIDKQRGPGLAAGEGREGSSLPSRPPHQRGNTREIAARGRGAPKALPLRGRPAEPRRSGCQ